MKPLLLLLFASMLLPAQERVLLHIGPNGQQEAIPLKKGESVRAVIEQREQQRAERYKTERSAGLKDTLKYFGAATELTTNFGWYHQDLALQWYQADAPGIVKEFWWLNYLNCGVINKGTIRGWHVNAKLGAFPASPNTKFIGAYKDAADGDGGVQPFKPATGNQWFYSNGGADSTIYSVDPFSKEANWLAGGLQVTLDSNKWQGVKLDDWGDSMNVALGEAFGFTLTNDTKKSDVGAGTDTRMEILSVASAGAPYHSYKYYETGRTAPSNAGWHMRGDYEWGMYTVIEYTGDRAPRITIKRSYNTTLLTNPRIINATITDDNPGGGASGIVSAVLYSKGGTNGPSNTSYMINVGSEYSGTTVAALPGDTVYWYITATDVNGNIATTPVRSYSVFKKTRDRIFIYNNAGFSRANANLIYTGSSTGAGYNFWSAPSDGIEELPALMGLYGHILLVDGSFPSRNVYPALKTRFAAANVSAPVTVFFSSQDYGCYIQSVCADTTFSAGSMEYDYFGLDKIGTQDIPPTNREFSVVPQPDTVTNYLIKFGKDSNVTLWCDPTFELAFASYQDNIVPRAEAKRVLKDAGVNTWGVKYITPSVRTFFASIDIGSLFFSNDTASGGEPHSRYFWVPTKVGALPNAFFASLIVTSVPGNMENLPYRFELGQNYPNPFNPTTTIEYTVGTRTSVTITIYNALGQRIATLVEREHSPGRYTAEWNASRAASGLYFYEMRAGANTSVKKMLLLK